MEQTQELVSEGFGFVLQLPQRVVEDFSLVRRLYLPIVKFFCVQLGQVVLQQHVDSISGTADGTFRIFGYLLDVGELPAILSLKVLFL
jgi:hypothetical protein